MNAFAHKILLVEDNEDDIFLLRRALKASGIEATLEIVRDGQEALDYFERLLAAGNDGGALAVPDLVLLDLKLPYVHGFEVLAFIRGRAELSVLNVIALTSSGELRDQDRAALLGVQGYHVKPPSPAMLADVGRLLADAPARASGAV